MANPEHLEIIRQGVEVWNKWREENPEIQADLSYANLRGADFRETNFIRANLRGADFREANFIRANLSLANLIQTNLRGADFREANLIRANIRRADLSLANLSLANFSEVQILSTNLENTTLTGACIKDWHINTETHLKNIKCDYVFLDLIWNEQEKIYIFTERRPHQKDKKFEPGDFETLVRKAQETVNIIFREGRR